MRRILLSLIPVVVLVIAAFTDAQVADPERDKKVVGDLMKSTVNKVFGVLLNDELSIEEKRRRVRETLDPLADYALMAKLSLGRKHWGDIGAKQRDAFTKLFVETLRGLYYDKLDLFADETVEIEDPVAKKNKFHVVTYIVSKGERNKVVYKLYRKENAWKIYDFEIEGVSIVKSYGSQYDEFLREGSFDELLKKMKDKIDSSREKGRASEPKKEQATPEEEKSR